MSYFARLFTFETRRFAIEHMPVEVDHSPFRQTFELGIFTSTAVKSILNLVKWRSLVAKHCKMWKI